MKKYASFLFYIVLTAGLVWSVTYLYRLGRTPLPAVPKDSATKDTTPLPTTPPALTTPGTIGTTAPPEPDLDGLFPAYSVIATLKTATASLPQGYRGAVKYGKGGVFYRVISPKGEAVRVAAEDVTLSAPKELSLPKVDKAQIEALARKREWTSDTSYLVVCCLFRLECYVFSATPTGWELMKRMDCSAGDLSHPTPTGAYKVEAKYPAIGKAGEYTCPYAVGFFGNYLFHSIPLAPDRSAPVDARIGGRISNGCIRLRTEDALWLYQAIPLGTAVVIF